MAEVAFPELAAQHIQTSLAPKHAGCPTVPSPAPRIVKKLEPTAEDRETLAGISIAPEMLADDFFDYSKVVVKKPWGYEYLIFQNEAAAIWILFIKEGFETSLHCHPRKQTSITVLSGTACCSVLESEVFRHPGDVMLIGKGVFHRTRCVSPGGSFVMEIEAPVNKRDLVRFKDDYGREKMGYESIDHMSFNLHNYNYTSFIDTKVYYNVKKRFGNCSIQLAEFFSQADFERQLGSTQWTALSILKGNVASVGLAGRLSPGDTVCREEIPNPKACSVDGKIETLILNSTDTLTRLSDFVVSHLKARGLRDIFFVAGTTNAHLIDAVGRDTEVCSLPLQTEHAATLAAEAYAKLTGKPGVVFLSSGASATQAITGAANAWIDSAPLLIVSGRSRPSDLSDPAGLALRQLANKELEITEMVRPVAKHTGVITEAGTIRAELDRAISRCSSGRPGPAWLDIPIDILGMNIDEEELASSAPAAPSGPETPASLQSPIREVLRLLEGSQRPVILAGYGIRAAGAQRQFVELTRKLAVPVLTSRRGADLVPEDFPFFFGRPGTYGQRAANFIVQNADLLISIGSRLSLPLIGRNYRAFARGARKICVDIDPAELAKTTVRPDLGIAANAADFIHEMMRGLPEGLAFLRPEWLERCRRWRRQFPPSREYGSSPNPGVNPYRFIEALSDALAENDILVVDGGPSLDYVMQSFRVKSGQRIISSPGLEHQGFALPGAIGAALAARRQRIVCLCEKKGLQLNIPELQTVVNNKLPLKAFIFNSRGDRSVQQVQAAYFGGRYVGFDSEGIIGSLNVGKLGEAYHIPTEILSEDEAMDCKIRRVLGARARCSPRWQSPKARKSVRGSFSPSSRTANGYQSRSRICIRFSIGRSSGKT